MARKLFDIIDSMIAEKNLQPTLNDLQPNIDSAQTILNDLTSPSAVADWRLWVWITAVAAWTQEKLWDLFSIEVDKKIKNAPGGSTRWYAEQAKTFQLGDTLVWIDQKYQYAVIDPTKQIIKRSAAVDDSGPIVIKVAKLVGSVVTKLNPVELASFKQFIKKIKWAGPKTIVISDDPDLLKVAYTVYYDPLVLASDGSLLTSPSIFPVNDAINNYASNLDFNGDLILTKLTDAIQNAAGVKDPVITSAAAKFGAGAHTPITVKYNANAGHLIIDPAFPLSTQITYLPNV